VYKKHSGVQREFSRQVKEDPRVHTSLRTFLSHTYQQIEAARRRAQGVTLQELADSYDRGISTMRRTTHAA
jgi:uncharacterized protein (UPF0332 family)